MQVVAMSVMLKVAFVLFSVLGVLASSPTRPNEAIRIIGGHDIDIIDAPYQVSLRRLWSHICGGALIAKDLVITAAHCVHNTPPNLFAINMGTPDRNHGGSSARVLDLKWHPNFTFSTMDSDIAIMQLDKSMNFTERLKPIELISKGEEIAINATFNVTGWGYTREETNVLPRFLQMVTVTLVSESSCKAAYEPKYQVSKNMLCAGFKTGGKDACQGDSGGPLVKNNKLVGMVSWGIGCGRSKYPGVYTKISALRDWVDETVAYFRSKNILRGPILNLHKTAVDVNG